MRQHTITGHHEARYPVAAALWIVAGVMLLLAVGDVVILLALAVTAVGMAITWSAHRTVVHRGQRNDVEVASVTQLRSAATGHRDLKKFSALAPWGGHGVA